MRGRCGRRRPWNRTGRVRPDRMAPPSTGRGGRRTHEPGAVARRRDKNSSITHDSSQGEHRMSSHLRKAALAALVLAGGLAAARAESPAEINFGVISTEASMNQKKNWEPFVEAMSKATGLRVKAFYATDYAGVIEAMRFNKVHVAWFGNKSGMEAVDRANGEVFAQVVAKDGSTGYYSHVIVRADSPYGKLDDLLKCDKTLNFGIGDPNSTSGFLVPTSYIFAARDI